MISRKPLTTALSAMLAVVFIAEASPVVPAVAGPIPAIARGTGGDSAGGIAFRAAASTVTVYISDGDGREFGNGSGFFVARDVIATNYHVVEGASSGYVKFANRDDRFAIKAVIAVDVEQDLALLYVPGTSAKELPLNFKSQPKVGDTVYAVGSPLAQEGTFSAGIISSYREDGYLQTTAAISPGSSGGPLLDSRGRVIGVLVATYSGGQNLNLAVPVLHLNLLLQSAAVRDWLQHNVA